MTAAAPHLATARLVLRPLAAGDLDAYAALWGDADVTRFIGGRPLSREEAWARLLRHLGHWHELGFGFWAIELAGDGRLAGEAGFQDLRRAIEPPLGDAPEAGWMIAPEFRGRGLAAEAVAVVHGWGDANLGAASTSCLIHPDNAASLRIAARAGYAVEAETTYHGAPTLVLRRPAGGG